MIGRVVTRGRTAVRALESRELLPVGAERATWREALGGDVAGYVTTFVVLVVLAAYVMIWTGGHWDLLTNPSLQNDDARTVLVAFHRYDGAASLRDDPIARDMLAFAPPIVRAIYAVLVPLTGLFIAAKIVQMLALLLILWAAVHLWRSRWGGVAAAAVLLFLCLHTPWVVNRVAGGLPRAFAFPAMMMWIAGALTRSERMRYLAVVIAAATYPSAMLMLLPAEGALTLVRGPGWDRGRYLRRCLRAVGLVVLCALVILPYRISTSSVGHVHTLEEAREEPAFYQDGRLKQLPFPNPLPDMAVSFAAPFGSMTWNPHRALRITADMHLSVALVVIAGLLLLLATRVSRGAAVAPTLTAACLVLYVVARELAFRLYSPERFYSYGMTACGIALAVAVVARVGSAWPQTTWRMPAQNGVALLLIATLWIGVGAGIAPDNGMTIDRRPRADFYAEVAALPPDVRIAVHPMDNDIPFWTGRATTDSFETLQPWIVEQWREYRERTERTLQALYATERETVLAYCRDLGITHILVDLRRYGPAYRPAGDISFEPLRTYVRELLSDRTPQEMVLSRIPPDAVVINKFPVLVVDVERLATAWREAGQ